MTRLRMQILLSTFAAGMAVGFAVPALSPSPGTVEASGTLRSPPNERSARLHFKA